MAGLGVGMTSTICPLAPEDLDAVVELERATYSTPWSRAVFEDELAQPGRIYLVARDERGVAGYAGLLVVGEEAHVTTVAVAADRRGRLIGTRLMVELVSQVIDAGARHLTLEVRPSNTGAQALYRRFGMAPVGVRKNYYPDEDALIMWVHDIDTPDYAALLADIRGGL